MSANGSLQGGVADKTLSIGQGQIEGVQQLIKKSMNAFRFDCDLEFPRNIETRGVENVPNYHFRDDAMALWCAIEEYVRDVIDIFYQTDEDVENDCELQQMFEDLLK